MAIRLHFVLLLVVVSAMAQTFQLTYRYSRGWTNGRKRADPSFIQQQQLIQHVGHAIVPAEFKSNSFEDWSRYRINNEKVNEDGDSWLVHVNHCAKLATSLVSVLKNKDVKSSDDDPLINVIH
uniref:Pro-corazonin n=1 Tax=Daphnia galeata TaxID=27404 RepID=A0A8J2RDF5_9CRUS|nr:unnamed protein product [Daphnia galeata]